MNDKQIQLEFIEEPIYFHNDFPWRKYKKEELLKAFKNLTKKITKSPIQFPIKFSYMGYKCTDAFFQKERLHTSSDTNISCIEYWNRNKQKILLYQKNQKKPN